VAPRRKLEDEAHVEEGLLHQPLEEADGHQRLDEISNLAALCQKELRGREEGFPRGACARYVDICSTWPYCSSLLKQVVRSKSMVARVIRSRECSVTFAGIRSTCRQVLERAKAEYGADNTHACSEAIGTVGAFVGGKYFGFLGALIGDKTVGFAAGNVIC
jgi:hypothetical protein